MRKSISIFAMLCCGLCTTAQQLPYHNQGLINPYSLSPAFTGHNSNFETFLTYRNDWIGVEGAPEVKQFSLNGPINSKMGLGGSVTNDQAGIFRSLSAMLSYSYGLTLSEKSSLTFGVQTGLVEYQIDLSGSTSRDQLDPLISAQQGLSEKTFNAGAAIRFQYAQFQAGFSAPWLMENEISNDQSPTNDVVYTQRRHYLAHATYLFLPHKNWSVQPLALLRLTTETPLFYEGVAQVKYKHLAWLNLTYRKGANLGIGIGALAHKRIALQYTYETAGTGVLANSSGSHEISIGFLIGGSDNKGTSVFDMRDNETRKSYYKWMNRDKIIY